MKKKGFTDLDRSRIRERWPQMRTAEKAGYIFHYYGIAIAFGLVLILAFVFFFRDYRTKKAENGFYVMAVETEADEKAVLFLQEKLQTLLGLDPQEEQVLIETGYSSSANFQNEATISTYMQSGRADLLIAREEDFNRYAATGYLRRLDETDINDLPDPEQLFYASPVDYAGGGPVTEIRFAPHESGGDAVSYGIYLTDGCFDGYVLGVLYNSPHAERIPKAVSCLMNGQENE